MATSLIKDKGEKEKLVGATDSKIEGKLRGCKNRTKKWSWI